MKDRQNPEYPREQRDPSQPDYVCSTCERRRDEHLDGRLCMQYESAGFDHLLRVFGYEEAKQWDRAGLAVQRATAYGQLAVAQELRHLCRSVELAARGNLELTQATRESRDALLALARAEWRQRHPKPDSDQAHGA